MAPFRHLVNVRVDGGQLTWFSTTDGSLKAALARAWAVTVSVPDFALGHGAERR
jgi:hypothetical protein